MRVVAGAAELLADWLADYWSAPAAVGQLATLTARATLLLALGAAVAPLAGRRSAAARHLVCAATLAGVLALPLLRAAGPRWTSDTLAEFAGAVAGAVAAVRPASSGPAPTPGAQTSDADPPPAGALASDITAGSVLFAWAAGAAIGLATLARGAAARRRLLRSPSSTAAPPRGGAAVEDALRAAAVRLGVRRPVRIVWGPAGTMPMTWGVRHPVVVLPAALAAWPAAECDAVLRHELAHVRRGDAGWALVAELARAVFWFHPGVWLAWAARLRWQELAADALAAGPERHAYAAALVQAARALVHRPKPGGRELIATPAFARGVGLAERLRVLTAPDVAPEEATGACTRGRRACVLAGAAASAFTAAALGRASATSLAATSRPGDAAPVVATQAATTHQTPGDARGRRPGRTLGTGGQPLSGGKPSGAKAGARPSADGPRGRFPEAHDASGRLHHVDVGTEQRGAEHLALGPSHVGTGHVLVGIRREERRILAELLSRQGLTPDTAHARVRRLGTGDGPP